MQFENVSRVSSPSCYHEQILIKSSLLDSQHFLLPLLGARFPLEAAVGMNGRVWISAKEVKQIIAISRCIEAVDSDGGEMDEVGVNALLRTLDV